MSPKSSDFPHFLACLFQSIQSNVNILRHFLLHMKRSVQYLAVSFLSFESCQLEKWDWKLGTIWKDKLPPRAVLRVRTYNKLCRLVTCHVWCLRNMVCFQHLFWHVKSRVVFCISFSVTVQSLRSWNLLAFIYCLSEFMTQMKCSYVGGMADPQHSLSHDQHSLLSTALV